MIADFQSLATATGPNCNGSVVAAVASGAIETTGNPQQDRCRYETRGDRCDSVDETSNDLRTSGLKRCIALARHFGGGHHRHWPFE